MSWDALGGNPVPGDEGAVLTLAGSFGAVAHSTEVVVGRLRSIDDGTGPTVWKGPAANGFRKLMGEVGPHVVRMADAQRTAEGALRTYATALASAQDEARRAATDAERAVTDRHTAEDARGRAASEAGSWANQSRALQVRWMEGSALRAVAIDPGYAAELDTWLNGVAGQRDHARSRESDARLRESSAESTAQEANARLEAAKAAAGRAAQARRRAGEQLVRTLESVQPAGGRNWVLGVAERGAGIAKDIAKDVAKHGVVPYVRGGRELLRWEKGRGWIRRTFGLSAGTAKQVAKKLWVVDVVFSGARGVEAGNRQWDQDSLDPTIGATERGFRSAGAGGAVFGLKMANVGAGVLIGGAIGTLIPVPIVGTAVGAFAGALIGAAVGVGIEKLEERFGVEEFAQRYGAELGSQADDHLTDLNGAAGGVGRAGSGLLHGAQDTAGAIMKELPKWPW